MTIVTRRRTVEFTTVPNEIANDSAISFEARGLLIYLLAKPDQWAVNIRDIQLQGNIGRDKAYKLLRELKERGYILAEDTRTGGRFNSINYIVFDCIETAGKTLSTDTSFQGRLPKGTSNKYTGLKQETPFTENQDTVDFLPHTENPDTVIPDTAKPDTENADAIIRNDFNKNISPKPPRNPELQERTTWGRNSRAGKAEAEALFDELWSLWPERLLPDTKAIAASRFKKLTSDEQNAAVQHAESFLRLCDRSKRAALMIPYIDEKAFEGLVGGPSISPEGYFVIERNTPEWDAWKEWFQKNHGPTSVQRMSTVQQLQRQTRYPAGYEPKENRK
ncbi:helix-turn-helix domain-containing protein [Brucella sp. HL-2]|nr:helix-turn-helix domain-containing protein [Brucella sp. HL-2]MCV9910209.1 helix-turn-helix domain-containing protein [Brucella sp. HL-2]